MAQVKNETTVNDADKQRSDDQAFSLDSFTQPCFLTVCHF